jgi:hypothetical protein
MNILAVTFFYSMELWGKRRWHWMDDPTVVAIPVLFLQKKK